MRWKETNPLHQSLPIFPYAYDLSTYRNLLSPVPVSMPIYLTCCKENIKDKEVLENTIMYVIIIAKRMLVEPKHCYCGETKRL
jgi:hypothetical protein